MTDMLQSAPIHQSGLESLLFEQIEAAVIVTDPHGIVTHWNPRAEALFGWTRAEAIGRDVRELTVGPEEAGFAADLMDRLRRHEGWQGEFPARRKDGTSTLVLVALTPVVDEAGTLVGIAGVSVDVTERKRAEQRLRFLAEASGILTGSLDYGATLDRMAGLAVPEFSDWCIVYGLQPDGSIRRMAMAHHGTAMAEAAKRIRGFRMRPDAPGGVAEVIRTGRSRLVPDVTAEVLAEDVEDREGLIRLLGPLGIASWICVPLTARGRTLGAISFVRSRGRPYDEDDLRLAEEIARHAAIALDNALLFDAEREARRATEETARQITLLQGVTAALSEALTAEQVAEVVVDRVVDAFGAVAGLIATTSSDGESLEIVRAVGYSQDLMDRWRTFSVSDEFPLSQAVRTGQPVLLENLAERTERYPAFGPPAEGTPDHAVACVPLLLQGKAIGGLVLSFEVARAFSERDRELLVALGRQCAQALQRAGLFEAERAARREAERTREQLAFLAGASATLSSSLDYGKTLGRVARLAVPSLADWCSVDMVEEDGSFRQLAVAHVHPAKVKLARALRRRYPPQPSDPTGVPAVVRTGQPELYPEVTEELVAATTPDPNLRRLIRDLQLRSVMIVPLRARGSTVGAMTFVWAESNRRYGPDDLALAEDLARRAAQAIDNARLYAERDHIARTLQESLLPPELPAIDGIELASRYLPAGQGNEVGGDFYDVFDTGDGTWGVAIGDVCGKGAAAAAVMGLARYTLRAGAMRESKPSRVLHMLNEAIQRQTTEGRFITVAYARLRARPGSARLTISCGGHPLPIVLRADGTLEPAGNPGTLLGLFPDPVLTDRAVDLMPGDTLVMFTDGLTEIPGSSLMGERRFHDVLATCAGLTAEETAERLERDVMRAGRRRTRDDMAALLLRVTP